MLSVHLRSSDWFEAPNHPKQLVVFAQLSIRVGSELSPFPHHSIVLVLVVGDRDASVRWDEVSDLVREEIRGESTQRRN